ncbi:MAG: type IV pilus assembly protein PilM [Deltaproteobacteria bacterium]|nr:type IV pilus assembly protein PilM [Deltaproteobacteria bacterium]
MFFTSKKVLGLDIGTNSIKIAELDLKGSSATLQNFGFLPTPVNSMAPEEIKDAHALGSAISNLISEMKTKRKNASVGLSGTSVIVRKIKMPKMEDKLLKEQIKFEAEQYIPFDIQNISLTHVVLNKQTQDATMDVLLVAAQNEIVSQYLSVIENANLKTSIVDVTGFALANIFEFNYGKKNDLNVGILSFGASVINFIVMSKGEVVFCRDILAGGINYTNEISKNLGISLIEAETLKISASSKKEVPEEVTMFMQMTTDSIVEEIKNSLDLLNVSTNGITIDRFFYTGGASATFGLIESLHKSTGAIFEHLNPFKKVSTSSKKFSPQFVKQLAQFSAVAMGLGLRQVGDND